MLQIITFLIFGQFICKVLQCPHLSPRIVLTHNRESLDICAASKPHVIHQIDFPFQWWSGILLLQKATSLLEHICTLIEQLTYPLLSPIPLTGQCGKSKMSEMEKRMESKEARWQSGHWTSICCKARPWEGTHTFKIYSIWPVGKCDYLLTLTVSTVVCSIIAIM